MRLAPPGVATVVELCKPLAMPTFEVRYTDGSRDIIEADDHESVGGEEHFISTSGANGEERWRVVQSSRIEAIERR